MSPSKAPKSRIKFGYRTSLCMMKSICGELHTKSRTQIIMWMMIEWFRNPPKGLLLFLMTTSISIGSHVWGRQHDVHALENVNSDAVHRYDKRMMHFFRDFPRHNDYYFFSRREFRQSKASNGIFFCFDNIERQYIIGTNINNTRKRQWLASVGTFRRGPWW